jgi:hypothetical protein
MKLTNKALVEEVMGRIEATQQHIQSLENIVHHIHSYRRWDHIDIGAIHQSLMDIELNEWRNLFMWALTLTSEEQARIKAAAYERFLRKGMSIAHWLNNGVLPGQWLSADEQEFREMAARAFGSNNV